MYTYTYVHMYDMIYIYIHIIQTRNGFMWVLTTVREIHQKEKKRKLTRKGFMTAPSGPILDALCLAVLKVHLYKYIYIYIYV